MRLILTNIGQLVTLAGAKGPRVGDQMRSLSILEDVAVVCENGKIVEILPSGNLRPTFRSKEAYVDVAGRVVTPGLIDAHTHLVFAGTRIEEYEMRILGSSYSEIAALGGGIRSTVRRTQALDEDELLDESRQHLEMMLACGTTTAEVKSGYGLSKKDELKILRVVRRLAEEARADLVPTFLGAHEIPDEYRSDRDGYVRLVIEEMLPAVSAEGLARYCDVFCEERVFSLEEARAILLAARSYGLGLRLHADQLTLSGGAALAAELRAATADHLEQIGESEMTLLRDAEVMPVLLPGSVFHLGLKKYPLARRMIDLGLAVVIATDFNPGSSPTPSLPMVMSLACTQMQMTPAEALTACTINAACSLGMEDSVGSIEVGKQADLVVFNCTDYRQIPYFFGMNLVRMVIKRGKVLDLAFDGKRI
ncbi:MAG: imidazolonepropionase [Acidobacteriota bacterium]|nr:imidazolonepropionase [Blastocatellia bacterium]MDW8413429.1 imidazolonepropionase [Acidobacteriota bacterium]